MKLNLLAFGIAHEILGSKRLVMEVPEKINVRELHQLLITRYPELGKLISFMLAVNDRYAGDDELIIISDEIAIIPPVSGG